jgi:hypothetical protein
MHIAGNLISLSFPLSQISSQSLDCQHSQPWCQREQQQQQQEHQLTSTTNVGACIDYANSDAANYAIDYGEHATGARSVASTTTPAA